MLFLHPLSWFLPFAYFVFFFGFIHITEKVIIPIQVIDEKAHIYRLSLYTAVHGIYGIGIIFNDRFFLFMLLKKIIPITERAS
jgi:hypothetical protein